MRVASIFPSNSQQESVFATNQFKTGDCKCAAYHLQHLSSPLYTDPVEVVEGSPELIQLVLADALGISCQDLVLDFIDGAGDRGE